MFTTSLSVEDGSYETAKYLLYGTGDQKSSQSAIATRNRKLLLTLVLLRAKRRKTNAAMSCQYSLNQPLMPGAGPYGSIQPSVADVCASRSAPEGRFSRTVFGSVVLARGVVADGSGVSSLPTAGCRVTVLPRLGRRRSSIVRNGKTIEYLGVAKHQRSHLGSLPLILVGTGKVVG
jgi:hypothetical protein